MPAETNPRREILFRVRKRLAVVTQAGVDREIARHVNAVLDECGIEPLIELVAADAEADWLCVLLHVGERQLVERLRRRVPERKRTEHRRAGLVAAAAGMVIDDVAAETDVMPAARPRQRIGNLQFV